MTSENQVSNSFKLIKFENSKDVSYVFNEGDKVKAITKIDAKDIFGVISQTSRYKIKDNEGMTYYCDVYFVIVPHDEENSRWYFRNEIIKL